MVKAQWNYVQRKDAPSTAATGTATYDLPKSGYIPEILVTAFCTPTASTNPALPLDAAITKIELKDGGNIIKSITGNQAKGLSMIHKYRRLGSTETNDNGVEGYTQFFLQLGGFFNGEHYAPNMAVFNNPQIAISWDHSLTSNEFGASYDADTAPVSKFSILCNSLLEPGPYKHGYVKSTILKEFTQATSTEEQTKIPTGERLIGIGVEAGYDALDFAEDVEEIELDFNTGEWRPFHLYEEEVNSIQQAWFKEPFQFSWTADMIDAKELDTHMGYLLHVLATPGIDSMHGLAFRFDAARKGVETVDLMDLATPTACSTYQQIAFTSIGYEPFHMWYCPMSKIQGGEDDLLDTSLWKDIKLTTKSGSSASTSSTPDIVAEYLMT